MAFLGILVVVLGCLEVFSWVEEVCKVLILREIGRNGVCYSPAWLEGDGHVCLLLGTCYFLKKI